MKKRKNDHLKVILLVIGIYMIAQSFYVYSLADAVRNEISPDRLNISLAYIFMSLTAGICFLGYCAFYRK